MDEIKIFRFLRAALEDQEPCALVSVLATAGPSMRLPGAHLAVAASGEYIGSVSGGCIERAVVAEAQEVITRRAARVTRYGKGSKYIDIRLPCGGSMDLHFQPWDDLALTDTVLDRIGQRQPFSISLGLKDAPPELAPSWQQTTWDEQSMTGRVGHWPRPHLLILGQGENGLKLAEIATAWGAEIDLHSPDQEVCTEAIAGEFRVHLLTRLADLDRVRSDPWTAIVLLFHDHDWEVPAIEALLDRPHFYFGAMGSHKTHQRRIERLLAKGMSTANLDRICAPIGLVSGSRDPASLAISIMAEIVQHHKAANFPSPTGES